MTAIANQIGTVIETRLSTLAGTTVSGVLLSVVNNPLRGTPPTHGQIAILVGANLANDEYSVPGNPFREGRTQVFNLAVTTHDETAGDHPTIQALDVYSEIKKKIVSSTDWYTFGGLSVDAKFGDMEPVQEGGLTIPVEVYYRTPEGAPDTV